MEEKVMVAILRLETVDGGAYETTVVLPGQHTSEKDMFDMVARAYRGVVSMIELKRDE